MSVFKTENPSGSVLTEALAKDGLCRVNGARSNRAVRCLQGLLWITQEGDGRDRFLTAGEAYRTSLPGFVLVQALDESRIEVSYEKAGRPRPVSRLLQRRFSEA